MSGHGDEADDAPHGMFNTACLTKGADAERELRHSWIHVYLYLAEIELRPTHLTLLDHWVIRYEAGSGRYEFEWNTTGQVPGCYDLYLSVPDGSSRTFRLLLSE